MTVEYKRMHTDFTRSYTRITSGYMGHAFVSREQQIAQARAVLLDPRVPDFDTMVGSGLSGTLLVPRLADVFECHWLIVRKPQDVERSHAHQPAEGNLGRRWLFVDDFISGGLTVKRCIETIGDLSREFAQPTECVGAYLYRDSEYRTPENIGWYVPNAVDELRVRT